MPKQLTSKDFIDRSIKIHGEKYDYSQVNYTGLRIPVIIICKIHGTFTQRPYRHLNGRGCQKCGGSKVLTLKEFIDRAKTIHGIYYCYDKSIYKNNSTKLIICCPSHGEFLQTPQCHLEGQGCPKCVGKNKTTEEFIKKANLIHNNKYDYSNTIYRTSKQKVVIYCPTHGKFHQIPDGHINGKKGCPKCHSIISKQEEDFLDYLNIPKSLECRQIKILRKKVDGYDPITKTIYEFLGDYWHGNPKKFKSNEINYHCQKTFKHLYTETIQRFELLKQNGYNIKYIWEVDWENWVKNKNDPLPIRAYSNQYI